MTGHYHEYAYGPKLDGQGNLWFTLNMGLGLKDDQLKRAIREPTLKVEQGRWRGWAMQVGTDGKLVQLPPVCVHLVDWVLMRKVICSTRISKAIGWNQYVASFAPRYFYTSSGIVSLAEHSWFAGARH